MAVGISASTGALPSIEFDATWDKSSVIDGRVYSNTTKGVSKALTGKIVQDAVQDLSASGKIVGAKRVFVKKGIHQQHEPHITIKVAFGGYKKPQTLHVNVEKKKACSTFSYMNTTNVTDNAAGTYSKAKHGHSLADIEIKPAKLSQKERKRRARMMAASGASSCGLASSTTTPRAVEVEVTA